MPGGKKKQKGKGKPPEKVSLVAEEEMLETNSESGEESLAKSSPGKKGRPPQASRASASGEANLESDEKIPPSRPKKIKRDTVREQQQKKDPITSHQLETHQTEPSSDFVEEDESEESEEEMECAPYVTTRARGRGIQSKKMKLKDELEGEGKGLEDTSHDGEKKEPTVQVTGKRGSRKKQQDSAGRGLKQTRGAVSMKGKKSATTSDEATASAGKEEEGGRHSPPRQYWLMKSEPETRIVKGVDVSFGLQDLIDAEEQTASWDGVRNAQARNIMRDQMKVGDKAFFYHSNCKKPGIAGLVEIIREGYVDPTQFNEKDPHYDHKSTRDNPKWFMVDVKFVRAMKFIPLSELKKHSRSGGFLSKMSLFNNSRLSVQPVTPEEFLFITDLEQQMEEDDQPGPL